MASHDEPRCDNRNINEKRMRRSLIVSLDFDGTLVNTFKYPVFDPKPLPGCLECIEWLERLGCKFILLTQRDDAHLQDYYDPDVTVLDAAVDWCREHKIKLWGINENPTQHQWSVSRKVYSDIIIDDRNACMPLDMNGCVDWIKLRKILEKKLHEN